MNAEACAQVLEACACLNIRKASRIVTQMYDDVLQPTGLRSTQIVILLGIAAENEACSITQLARELGLDPSTLNRNLQPLSRMRLVKSENAPDGRRKILSLTAKGRKTIETAAPLWKAAQERFTSLLGESQSAKLLEGMRAFSAAAIVDG